ncbi:hypothetical protein L2E82_45766 [Cichorium intybus]|uniref:Uncharacterized protein n=1 Tax=Cichorium intybus TaxID=13427 RepID=A0ACB8ZTT2_CICIN|nr:hypothetical protein L2E82_45766 [Cichorium intybus]
MEMGDNPQQHFDNDRSSGELRPVDCNLISLCDHIQMEGFNNGSFSDVVVQAMGATYHLHRLILCRRKANRQVEETNGGEKQLRNSIWVFLKSDPHTEIVKDYGFDFDLLSMASIEVFGMVDDIALPSSIAIRAYTLIPSPPPPQHLDSCKFASPKAAHGMCHAINGGQFFPSNTPFLQDGEREIKWVITPGQVPQRKNVDVLKLPNRQGNVADICQIYELFIDSSIHLKVNLMG